MAWKSKLSVSRSLSLALLVVTGLAIVNRAAGERIPEVHGTSFANLAVNLPAALQGKSVGILVIGFSRGSREEVTGWATKIAADYRTSTVVAYYELPIVAGVPGFVRGVVLRSIKSSTPERAQPRVVPVTNNEAGWKAITHYGEADDAYLLVVDNQGNVVWQTQGQPTDKAYAALKQQVESLKTRMAP
ncbi:hypothetical protein [Tunturibacter empetritectus]|uniref:Uncharacterized protein n=1 Tax=Tunturiibacter lichenicola TaxID=2051959 RepID=A0A7W8J8P9_9BACT|nr:hypothetical protein [Edaphobacter lichenicola]MBB5343596.1 hypothetical protein [Edaphobacter lichenicola]